MINVQSISKSFNVQEKEPGLRGSLKGLFSRKSSEKWAVKDVSFQVQAGEIVGLVGANGAGKTTLVKMLSGVVFPSSGSALVRGFVPWERSYEFRRSIALIMGQKAQLWWDLPAYDCFLLLREIYQIDHSKFKNNLAQLVEMLEVKDQLKIQIRRLSLGERMKMELIAALLHSPQVVYLDEPTIGLDLSAQRSVRKFLLQYRKDHSPAMILTSHYMEDIEALCERIVIMRQGSIVYDGAKDAILENFAHARLVRFRLAQDGSFDNSHKLQFGSVVPGNSSELIVKTERQYVAQCIKEVLDFVSVQDIAVEEEDISNVIERFMLKGNAEVTLAG